MIVSHEVRNFEEWRVGFDADASNREQAGISVIDLYRGEDNPNMITLISEIADIEGAKAMLNNPELKEKMASLGVISAPEVKILISAN